MLGGFAVRVGDTAVAPAVWRQRRAAAIVKLLALEPGHRLHREQLIELLWAELDPESAANNLRVALHHARRGLEAAGAPPGHFLVRAGETLLLGPPEAVETDVASFSQALTLAWQRADPDVAEAAAARYGGELLPEDPYDEWAAARREGLRTSYVTLLARLAGLYEAQGDLTRALVTRERALAVDPLDESAHVALMRLQVQLGEPGRALAQYAHLEALLAQELGTAPERETRALAGVIRQRRLSPVPAPAPVADQGIAAGARLPAAVDALVGRERELAELARLLAGERLVTLTGPGGIGKTRLAQEAARAAGTRFPAGVAFIDLAPLREPGLVLPSIARALLVDESGGQPIAELVATAIGERRLLLVLDNLEQLPAAGPGIAALLAACPNLAVLATSRVRLRLRGEQEYLLTSLALPEGAPGSPGAALSAIARSAAVALFVRRAQAARPSFALTAENAAAVAAVCHRLDGLPLAIELAATRVRVLAPDQLRRRLAQPRDALGMHGDDLPKRQRTLRDTIAWSHDLLSPAEQTLFRRLGVFAGGCALEWAEAIANPDGEAPADPLETLETLAGLIDHSLVGMRPGEEGPESRYAMLETIREFAAERLVESGEADRVQLLFEKLIVTLAAHAEAGLSGPAQLTWLARLGEEHDNIRAALGHAIARHDGVVALTLATQLRRFWWMRGHFGEGRAWLERALAVDAAADPALVAAAEHGLADLAAISGDFLAADAHIQTSIALRRELGDLPAVAESLSVRANVALNLRKYEDAQALGDEALQIFREHGDRRGIAGALYDLALVSRGRADYAGALQLLEASLAIWRGLDDAIWTATVALGIGMTHRLAGTTSDARAWLTEASDLYHRLGDRFGMSSAAIEQGHLARMAGETDEAIGLYGEAMAYFSSIGYTDFVVYCIEFLAAAAASGRDAALALRLFGATAAARAKLGFPPVADYDAKIVTEGCATASQAVGDAARHHLAAGAALSLDQARAAARELVDHAAGRPAES